MGYDLPLACVFGAVANIEHARSSRHKCFIIVTRYVLLTLVNLNSGKKYDLLLEEPVSVPINNIQSPFIGDRHMVVTNTDDFAMFSMRRVNCRIFLTMSGTYSDPYVAKFGNKRTRDST